MKALYPYIAGYLFSVLAGHIMVKSVVQALWDALDKTDDLSANWRILSGVQGFIERLLYTIAWQFGEPSFIAIWLGLKAASQWKKWTDEPGYNAFLVGSGMSVLFGVVGAMEINWVKSGNWLGLLIPAIVVETSLILLLWVRWRHKVVSTVKAAQPL